ncbi:lipoprotein [Actinokineospora diospyrosa]|uniref:DUF3558 domain-containing protein n=1 Tax=Actinokineospora diospyrosa TaxID=103728 RepID=A0ABT1I519_9PSEU|nr:lipoprotein [Actinokineospora diospyrosa]MCP2267730.1 hypothetical protein [Actinokineospora diospyrosa]
MRAAVVVLSVVGVVLAGCGSDSPDPWAEGDVPAAGGNTESCLSGAVLDVPAGWQAKRPESSSASGKDFRLDLECEIGTGTFSDGELKVYKGSGDPEPREVLRDTIDAGYEHTDVDIRDATIGGFPGAEATWRVGDYIDRAFVVRTGANLAVLVLVDRADQDNYEKSILPVYLLAKKSIRS